MALKPRLVVVGTGSIGRRHARILSERKELQVELCDSDPDSLSEAIIQTGNLPQHHSFDAMLESKPEMVLIATPPDAHAEQTIKALEAGAHVLCEKPMSGRLDTAYHMLEASRKSDRVLDFGFSNHFHPGVLEVKKMIDDGQLGELLYAHFHVGTYGTLVKSRSRHQAHVEGALLLDYVHQPDLLYWLLSQNPSGVYAAGSSGGNKDLTSNPNSITMLLDYDGPLTASIHLNYLQYPDRYHYEFLGDQGWIYYDLNTNMLRWGDGSSESINERKIEVEIDGLYDAEHQAFLDTIAGKRSPESPAQNALQSMIFREAAIESWKSKQRVDLQSIAGGGGFK